MKLFITLLMLFSTQVIANVHLNVDDCLLAGRIIEQMAQNKDDSVPNDKLLSSVIADLDMFRNQHESIQELFKFSALLLVRTNTSAKPEQQREGFNRFCLLHNGNVNKMIKLIKDHLKIREEDV